MVTFLFWNIQRKPLAPRAARMVAGHGVDVVVLAECETPDPFTAAFEAAQPGAFRPVAQSAAGLHVWFRGPITWEPLQTAERWLAFRSAGPPETVLFVTHLPSKLHTSEDDQRLVVRSMVADIEATEQRRGHRRTVVVGDFNMDPFERGMTAFGELHAIMARGIAAREVRTVRGQQGRMFYNPTWGLFGDRTPGPPGTYYRGRGGAVNYFWHVYDQVLLRPAVADRLDELRILDSDGAESLLTKTGIPDAENGSDHLPLFFRLDL